MKKILIVEDNPTNLELTVQLLEDDFEILVATDGEEGLALATEQLPDLVLMDLSLPKMDGCEATRRLRRNPRTEQMLVIALSAHAHPSHMQAAANAGCNAYVTKPLDEDLLLDRINGLLESRGG